MNTSVKLSNSMVLVLLLGTSSSLAKASGMLFMSVMVVGVYGVCMSLLRPRLMPLSTLLTSVVLAATLTACAEIFAQRWSVQWHQALSLYTGMIALQCVVLEHNGFFRQSLAQRLKLGIQFGGLMVLLAVLRELIGQGSLGRDLSEHWREWVLFRAGLHWLTLVPGALILLGLLLAAHQAWTRPNSISKETHRP